MTTRRLLLSAGLTAPFVARAAEPFRLRVSLDTTPLHGRTIAVADYLRAVETASGGRIVGKLFDSGQLFADRDVVRGLVQGQTEMCVPGTWLVSAFLPDIDVCQLPAFYGRSAADLHRVIDGATGRMVSARLAAKLPVIVLGPWLDLGFTNWYSTQRPLRGLDDLRGLKIRNSGGYAQAWRARFFGGIANMTPWPDVPLALSQGTFDAIQTTNESIASAKLWEAGLRYALEDHQSPSDYVPMVSATFWASLPGDLRTMMTDIWAERVPRYRTDLMAAQDRARAEMQARGVRIVFPDEAAILDGRRRQMAEQDSVAAAMKISPDVLRQMTADLEAAA